MASEKKRQRPGANRPLSDEQKRVVVLVKRLLAKHTLEEIAQVSDVAMASVSRWSREKATPYRSMARRVLPRLEQMLMGGPVAREKR